MRETFEPLDVLVERLERWPLALELAAAHLQTSGAGRDQVDHYAEVIRNHALDDPDLVPSGYPSTLVRVLAVAHERVAERDVRTGTRGVNLLRVLSVTGSRAVPTTLAWSAAARQDLVEGTPWERPVDYDPACAHLVDATVRTLTAQSLVRRHRIAGLDATGRWTEEACDVLSTNEIVQDVVRRLAGVDELLMPEAVGATLAVFGPAIEHGLNAGRVSSASLAEPHVVAALARAEGWGAVGLASITALGNLSVLALSTGSLSEAIDLTWRQEQMAERVRAAGLPVLTTATRAIAAQTRATAGSRRNSTPEQVFFAASVALRALDVLAEERPDHPMIASVFVNLREVLFTLADIKAHEPSRRALASLEERHGHVLMGSTDENLRTAVDLIEAGRSIEDDPAEAVARFRAILDLPSVSELQRVEAAAGLADALACTGDSEHAVSTLESADPSGRLAPSVVLHAGNVGSSIVVALLFTTSEGAGDLGATRRTLSKLLGRTCDLFHGGEQQSDTDPYDVLRSLTFRAAERWGAADRAGALSGLAAARNFQVENTPALAGVSLVRGAGLWRVIDLLEHVLLLDGSTRLG